MTEAFWEMYFRQAKLTLIQCADVSEDEAEEFCVKFSEARGCDDMTSKVGEIRGDEEVEDLLDLM